MIHCKELQERFKNEADKLTITTIQSFQSIIEELNKKENLINSKNKDIENINNELEKTKEKYKNKELEYLVLKKEVQDLKMELNQIQNSKGTKINNNDIVIIISPKDVFNYSESIINKYLENLNWNHIEFNYIEELMEYAIKNENLEAVDETIINVVANKLKDLSRKQFDTFITLIKKYIAVQVEIQKYSLKGIFEFINRINQLNYTELIKDLIKDTYVQLELIIINTNKSPERDMYLLEILNVLFILSIDVSNSKLVEKICKEKLLTQRDMEIKDYLNLLYIAVYFKKDIDLFDNLNELHKLTGNNLSEIDCYKIYNKGLEEKKCRKNALEQLKVNRKNNQTVNEFVNNKTVNFMEKVLEKLIENDNIEDGNIRQMELEIKFNNEQIKLAEEYESMEQQGNVINEVIMIKNQELKCTVDNSILVKKRMYLNYYSDKKKTKVEGYISIELLCCTKCKKTYFNANILKIISSKISVKKIKMVPVTPTRTNITEVNKTRSKQTIKSSSKVISKNVVSHYPTFGSEKENSIIANFDKIYENNLSEESDLKKLGYSTSLSKEVRWNILKNKAIPIIGIKKTIRHITFLINLSKNRIDKDYSKALQTWNYDLKRLEKL